MGGNITDARVALCHSPNETLNAIEEGVITLLAPFLCLPQLVWLSGFSTSDLGAFPKREG